MLTPDQLNAILARNDEELRLYRLWEKENKDKGLMEDWEVPEWVTAEKEEESMELKMYGRGNRQKKTI